MKAPPKQRRLIEEAGRAPEEEPLVPPSLAAQAEMSRHLGKEHRYPDFRLGRDVYLGEGERTPSQLLTWDTVQARFWCSLCPGRVFATGEITEAMVRHAQLFDEGLRPHLAGLYTEEAREEMTRLYLSGRLNREQLRRLQAAGPRHRAAREKRPAVAHDHRRVQAWMLSRMRVRSVLAWVLDEAEELQRGDGGAWFQIASRRYARETLAKIWADIDPALRAKARAEAGRGGAAGRS